jgi:hypothetical protein
MRDAMPSLKYTLAHHNVSLLDAEHTILKCNKCGQTWTPKRFESGRLEKDYWHCPKGCNFEPRQFKYSADVRSYFAQRNREYRKRKKALVEGERVEKHEVRKNEGKNNVS